jgi:thiol-disulfide isomerase/thioredoxin
MRRILTALVVLLAPHGTAWAQPKTIEVHYDKQGKILRTTTRVAPGSKRQTLRQVEVREISGLLDSSARATLLVLYASHCPACRKLMPRVAKLERKWRSKGLSVVALSLDPDLAALQRYLGKKTTGDLDWLRVRPYRRGELKREMRELGLSVVDDTFSIPVLALFDGRQRLVKEQTGSASNALLDRAVARLIPSGKRVTR